MKKRTWYRIAVSLALALLLCLLGGILSACKKDNPPESVHGEEVGVFYYDAEGDEYLVSLLADYRFTFTVRGLNGSGSYTLEEGVVTLTFEEGGLGTMTANLEGDALTLTFQGSSMRFLRKVSYTVSFNSMGGSAVDPVEVLNGKSLPRPKNPTRSGYAFVNWYTDEKYTTSFRFDAQPVTSDITLYAKWLEVQEGTVEYTVDFDLGYAAEAPESVTTVGGVVASVPAPVRTGYTFLGWWVSMYDTAEKLSYRYTDGTVLREDTTLHALWREDTASAKLPAPVVTVSSNTVRWDDIPGKAAYELRITGPDGFSVNEPMLTANVYTVNFASAPAGDYVITVKAFALSSADNDSETTTRYYRNKVLPRVSHFSIEEPSVLTWLPVDGATEYLVSVVCGNPAHNHTELSVGSDLTYDFSTCEMKEGGIEFSVTAAAAGRASSHSRTYPYDRKLPAVTNLRMDGETLRWDAVTGATGYLVTVMCGNAAHAHSNVDVGNVTEYSLKECAPREGGILIEVTPKARGYNSPEATGYTYEKLSLATPQNVRLIGYDLCWDEVANAEGYEVKVDDATFPAGAENHFLLTGRVDWTKGQDYRISVRALGFHDSEWSDALDARYLALDATLGYASGVLSWRPVIGAEYYEVRVNGLDPVRIDGKPTATVELSQESNLLEVRYHDAEGDSQWVSRTVQAYSVTFDTQSGSAVRNLFLAEGDMLRLPASTRTGYDFAGWYDAPTGPEHNAARAFEEPFTAGKNIVLYAYWSPKTYEVTLDYADGSGKTETVYVTYSKSFTLPVPAATETGDAFIGWYEQEAGRGEKYADEYGRGLGIWNVADDVTLYAYWTAVLSFQYLQNTDTYAATQGAGINLVTSVTVPARYNGKLVSTLEGYAFRNCGYLEEVNLPNTMSVIETSTAFFNCNQLRAVNIYDVPGNRDIRYSSSAGVLLDNNKDSGSGLEVEYYPVAREGGWVVPNGVVIIPDSAFAGTNLTEITIPETVTYIAANAFYFCAELNKVTFVAPKNEAASILIENLAFNNCVGLTEITLPARATFNEEEGDISAVFNNCINLSSVHVESGNAWYTSRDGIVCDTAGTTILYCPRGKSGRYTVPSGILVVGERSFYRCLNLTEIVIPGFVDEVESYAFDGCTNLRQVTFAAGGGSQDETVIGNYAFSSNGALETVVFEAGSNVVEIGASAFIQCRALTTFNVPGTVRNIGNGAFDSCSNLTKVEFAEPAAGNETLSFGTGVFRGTSLMEIYLPSHATFTTRLFDGCNELRFIKVAAGNASYGSYGDDGVLYNAQITEVLYYPSARAGAYDLPATVTTIGSGVFEGRANLTKIEIGYAVTAIGYRAFAGCTGLREVRFLENAPAGTTAQELVFETGGRNGTSEAFAGCTALETIVFPARAKHLGSGIVSFKSSSGSMERNVLTTVTLPEGIEEIGAEAFFGASMSALTLPQSLEVIGESAFERTNLGAINLPAALTSVGAEAFARSALTEVTLPANATFGAEVFRDCVSLERAGLANGRKDVPNSAFYGCTNLGAVTLPSGLEEIGANAFYGCVKLNGVTVPATVKKISTAAFKGCTGLVTLTIEAGDAELTIGAASTAKENGVFAGCTSLGEITLPARLSLLGGATFYNCTQLRTVTFAEGSNVTAINKETFSGCASLFSINLPDGVTTIGESAFGGSNAASALPALHTIALPASLSTIGSNAFRYSGLTQITFPASLLRVGQNAFANTSDLVTVTFTNGTGALVINNNAFQNSGVVTLNLSSNLSSIGDQAFANAEHLAAVNFAETGPQGGLTIGSGSGQTFAYCTALTHIELPDYVTTIARATFRDSGIQTIRLPAKLETITASLLINTALSAITIPETVKTIGANAFENTNLGEVSIPKEVTSLGNSAFAGNASLHAVTFAPEAKLTKIGDYAFKGTAITQITLPALLSDIKTNSFEDCAQLASIGVAAESEHYAANDGILYDVKTTKLILCPAAKTGSITLPSTVTTILGGSFKGSTLTQVTLPSTVTTVGEGAFEGAKVTAVVFQNGGTDALNIEANAFKNGGITSVTLPNRAAEIGANAFEGCTALDTITFAENVKVNIGARAFKGCTALEQVEFKSLIVSLGASAFEGCTALSSATFTGHIVAEAGKAVESVTLTIGASAFDGLTDFSSVTFPAYDTVIGAAAFRGTNLQTLTLPVSVKEIGTNAFYGCKALTAINFAEEGKLTEIGKSAFEQAGIAVLKLPAGITSIGEAAFRDCASLTEIQFATGGKLNTIGASAFRNTGLTALNLPASVTAIQNGTFAENHALISLTLNEGLIDIGASAFEGCNALPSVELPASVTSIGASAFKGTVQDATSALTQFTFRESVVPLIIGESAFEKTGLTSFHMPARVAAIGAFLFRGAGDLVTLTFDTACGITTIPDRAFEGTQIKELVLPQNVKSFYYKDGGEFNPKSTTGAFFGLTTLEKITLPRGLLASAITPEPQRILMGSDWESISYCTFRDSRKLTHIYAPNGLNFSDKDGVLYSSSGNNLIMYPIGRAEDYDIPEGTRSIGVGAFAFTAIQALNIPTTLTTINEFAFAASKLSALTFTPGGTEALQIRSTGALKADPFFGAANLKELEIPARMESLGEDTFMWCGVEVVTFEAGSRITTLTSAFHGANRLRRIELPSSITKIESNVFDSCDSLEEVVLPDGIDEIPANTFNQCEKLSEVNIPKTVVKIGSQAFMHTAIAEVVIPGGVTKIEYNAFAGCKQLRTVTFEHGTADLEIGANDGSSDSYGYETRGDAFSGCVSLQSVEIPARTSILHAGAFEGCTGLGEVTFENPAQSKLTLLGSPDDGSTFGGGSVFSGCTSLTAIELPDSITTIEKDSFNGCTSLASVKLPFRLTTIEEKAFKNTALVSVVLERNVSSIGDEAFYGCKELERIVFSTGLSFIGKSAFEGCAMLATCDFKQAVGLVTVSERAFYGCERLPDINLPNNVKTIGDSAFYGCKAANSIELPVGLVTIGTSAFDGCVNIPELVIPGTVTTIGEHAFRGVQTLKLEPTNTSYVMEDGVLYTADLTAIHTFPTHYTNDKNHGIYIVPSFMMLTSIPAYVFENSDVIEIHVPASVTSISAYAFANAHLLQKVVFEGELQAIAAGAFSGCEQLREVQLPVTLRSIRDGAFEGCTSLTELTLPATVESIGEDAFKGWGAGQKIVVSFTEDEIPEGFPAGWNGDATVQYATGEGA